MCTDADYADFHFLPHYKGLLFELPTWHKSSLPKYFENGVVVDIGAGCGETARYFFNHNARRVIALEFDPEAIEMMKENFPNAHIVPADVEMVIIPDYVDHIKIDIDGGERGMSLETHFPIKWRRIWHPFMSSPTLDANLWRLDKRWRPFLNGRWKWHKTKWLLKLLVTLRWGRAWRGLMRRL